MVNASGLQVWLSPATVPETGAWPGESADNSEPWPAKKGRKDADANLPVINKARAEFAKLQQAKK